MNDISMPVSGNAHFSAAHLGALSTLDQHSFAHDELPFEVPGKVFLRRLLGITGAEISMNKMAVGAGMPFYHKHQAHEEIYLFIGGQGQFQVDHQIFEVSEGSVVRVAPSAIRCWRNTGSSPLYYIVIQAVTDGLGALSTIEDGIAVDTPVQW